MTTCRALLLLCLAVGVASTALARLQTFVEPRLIEESESIRLTIRSTGGASAKEPDLTPLREDFEILSNQTSSRISTVNGRTQASVEYQISLRPKRTGELTVPPLTIGDERSEAIQLVVRPMDPQLKRTIGNMVFFETELSRNPAYVQAESVLTRRLFYTQGVQIYSDLPGQPEIEDVVVIPLGETTSRSVLRGGVRYGVIEQRFALFPERSGRLEIPATSVTSSVRLQTGGRTRRSGFRVSTEAMTLDVLPIPLAYPADQPWLPAADVRISHAWQPATGSISIGEPLTFEMTVSAVGNRGSAIPPVPLPLPADQLKIYPEAPQIEESSGSAMIIGQRRERYALIATRPGSLNVPALDITWWDTDADRLRRTSLPPQHLEISGAAIVEPSAADPTSAAGQEAVGARDSQDAGSKPDSDPALQGGGNRGSAPGFPGPWLSAAAALLVTALGVAIWLLAKRTDSGDRLPALDRLAGGERRRWRLLQRAARGGDPLRFRHALLDYLAATESAAGPGSATEALAALRRNPEADAALTGLDQSLYGDAPAATEPVDLAALAATARVLGRGQRRRQRTSPLPALYGS